MTDYLTVVRSSTAPAEPGRAPQRRERPSVSPGPAAARGEQDLPVTEAEALDGFQAPLLAARAEEFAQLVVTRADDEHFRVCGQHRDHVLAPGTRYGRPDVALGDLAREGGLQPEDLEMRLFDWSEVQPQDLRNWLQGLRALIGDEDLRLVVWDTTGFDIPWEALSLEPEPARNLPGGPLGVLVAVTRLAVVPDEGPGRADEKHVASGDVLSYIDEAVADLDVLGPYRPQRLEAPSLLRALEESQERIGLVYVGCHGIWSTEVEELRLGPWKRRDIYRFPLPALQAWRPLVFLNACHGGRLLPNAVAGGSPGSVHVFGFAEAFLRRGAGTVIGPTGPVERGLARRVAGAVLEQLGAHPEQPVAVAMRDARAAVAAPVLGVRHPRREDLKAFLYSCMYVCYGSPYSRLELAREAAP